MVLNKLLFGILEDNTSGFIVETFYDLSNSWYIEFVGYPFGSSFNPFISSELLIWLIYHLLSLTFGSIFVYNIFVSLSLFLALIFSYFFIKSLNKNNLVSFFLSLVLVLSPYFFVQTRSHLNLSQIWLLIVFLALLFSSKTKIQFAVTGVVLAILGGFSSYLLYFAILFTATYFFIKNILFFILTRFFDYFKKSFTNYFILTATFIVTFTLILLPFLKATFIGSKNTISPEVMVDGRAIEGGKWKLSSSGKVTTELVSETDKYTRSLEDFFYFTSRPWYYFLPNPENPWFGGLTKNAIDWLQNDWGYWLTTNYFPNEHSVSYLGWVNFVFAILGFIYLARKLKELKVMRVRKFKVGGANIPLLVFSRFKTAEIEKLEAGSSKRGEKAKYLNILILGLVGLVFVILTMPPYLTVSLYKIYMPSYLLWKVFPVFRVLTRLGVIILLIELVYTGLGYVYFLKIIKRRVRKLKSDKVRGFLIKRWGIASFFIILPFFTLSLMEFYVPLKFTDVSKAPKVFTYIKNNTEKDSAIAVYPYGKTNQSLFWLRESMRPLVNPRGFSKLEYGFSSKDFTFDLSTCIGILEARNLGTDYIVYFNEEDENQSLEFFENTDLLTKVFTTEELGLEVIDKKYYQIINASNAKSFSSILYRIGEGIEYEKEKEKCMEDLDNEK